MAHFFIDVFDGQARHLDEIGSDLPAVADARAEGVAALCDLMRHRAMTQDHSVLRTSIRNQNGTVVYEGVLTFAGIVYD